MWITIRIIKTNLHLIIIEYCLFVFVILPCYFLTAIEYFVTRRALTEPLLFIKLRAQNSEVSSIDYRKN